jgi:plastocyanin
VSRVSFAPLALSGLLALALVACTGGSGAPSPTLDVSPTTDPAPTLDASPTEDASPTTDASPTEGAGGEEVEITGVEYAFEGVPSSVDSGTTFTFTNGGDEVHEMVLIRRNEGVELTFEELLELPEEEAMEQVTVLEPVLIAAPGEDADGEVTLDEAGDYLMICFIPQGMRELPEGSFDPSAVPAGPPHFTAGMLAEFSVEE